MRRIVKLNQVHRILTMFLAIVMIVSIVPLQVFAAAPGATDGDNEASIAGTEAGSTFSTLANGGVESRAGGNAYYTIVGKKADAASEWYTGNVSIRANDGYQLSYTRNGNAASWKTTLENAVTANGTHTVTFYVKHVASGSIYAAQTVTIKKDSAKPTAKINHEGLSNWEKFLSVITLQLWQPAELNFTVTSGDAASGVAKVEFLVAGGTTEVMTEDALNAVADSVWKAYTGVIKVAKNQIFVVYTRVTDKAGNRTYASTNGIVFDQNAVPEDHIVMDILTEDGNGFYDEDVEIRVQISDALPSSGINTIYYEVYNNNVLTQGYGIDEDNGILYQYTNENPQYKDLVVSWDSAVDDRNILVDSEANNSDDVRVVITVIDNAGNKISKESILKICTDQPTMQVMYLDGPAAVQTHNGVTYYDDKRAAQVVITGRMSVLVASNAPQIVVTETKGDTAAGKTYEIVDYGIQKGATPDEATHTYLVRFNGDANYEFSVDYTDVFGNNFHYGVDVFAVDHENPTASVTIDEGNTWTTLLETLTFGLWKNHQVLIEADFHDATSPIKKAEMYKTDSMDALTSVQLDALYAEGAFTEYRALQVEKDEKLVVYIRVEDYAGHYSYVCSDFIMVDMSGSEISIAPEHTDRYHNDIPLYNGDVDVAIHVVEKKDDFYSGIKEVKYWVTCDGEVTQEKVLLYFSDSEIDYADLIHEFSETVTIHAAYNNSCDVELFVSVTDNAGNVETESVKVDIDRTAPTLQVEYNNNSPYRVDGARGYYSAARTATITIADRTGHVDAVQATAGIRIKAVDASGAAIAVNGIRLTVDPDGYLTDITRLFGTVKWTTEEGATPDETVYKAVLTYHHDANYTFAIRYEDLAGNHYERIRTDGQRTPYEFTVDQGDPTATITAEPQTWNKLLEVLSFGFFSNETVRVFATSGDVTSPIESVQYYKSNGTAILSVEELEAITSWIDITASPKFEISDEQRFAVYLKVTDYAGNYTFINSDGYVIDKTEASITLTPDATNLKHNNIPLYNGDVNVLINVVENREESYSGIKEVKYWVTCDGVITQEKVLYSFGYDMSDYVAGGPNVPAYADLLHEYTETVTIKAANNNSCNVVLYASVTDNAGNVKTASVAVDIDVTSPTITVDFDNDSAYQVVDGKGYFPSGRKATVVITEKKAHFNAAKATESIKITAVDANGTAVMVDSSALIGAWTTSGTGNNTKHTATIHFAADANYEFTLSYTDLAANTCKYENVQFARNTVTPRYFAVDTTAPVGTITAGNLGTWDKLIEILTFGLWSKNTVSVTGTAHDATSSVESVSYYRTADTTAKTVKELNAITAWTAFDCGKGFSVSSDETFVVYVKIADYAGNVTYISTNGIIMDDTAPTVESVKPAITITPGSANSVYKSDVTVAVSVVDPRVGATGAYAGLKEIRYEVYSQGVVTQRGTLLSVNHVNPTHGELRQSWSQEKAIVVDKDLNNSNDVKIVVYATDNAGNSSKAECKIKIDITAPTIEVTYDNNDGDASFAEGAYFRANRTAKIVIRERNFDPKKVELVITNKDGHVPDIGNWTTVAGTGNGDNTTHTAYVVFDQEGEYTFKISCTDTASNQNASVNYGDSIAPGAFTIDKTVPVVAVIYDNNDVLNGSFYKKQRVATITVTERNFDIGRAQISLKATNDGVDVALPTVSDWVQSRDNSDVYVATITYTADALYVFDFNCTDKAGNALADFAEQTFCVDQTSPVLKIEKIVDGSANNDDGNIGFVMTATDVNLDTFVPLLTALVKKGNSFETKQLEIGRIDDAENGKALTVTNIDTDGIYRITCTVVDKAGNAFSEVVLQKADGSTYVEERAGEDVLLTFSVNRDGSSYEVDRYTLDVVDRYYIQNVESDIAIVEVNVDPLKEYTVTLNSKVLEKDKDYTVTEEGGNGAWKKYTYKVSKDLFAEEGEYKLVVSSKDLAGNDAFSDVKDAAVEFVIDRTSPVVTVSGIADNGRYQAEKQTVTLIPTDDGGALRALTVNMVDENGKIIREIVHLTGTQLTDELEANGGKIIFEISEGLSQNIQIICTDCAKGENDSTNTYSLTIENVSVSTNMAMILWANPALRWGVIGGVSIAIIALVVLVMLKKKKRKAH